MDKKSVLWAVLDLIFVAVFNVVFFVAGGIHHPASVWISYGFIHFAYLMMIVTPLLTRKGSSAAVLGFAILSVSSAYFFAEFVVGLFFVVIRSEAYKAAILVQIIMAGIYGIILIMNLISNEYTSDNVERQEAEVMYIKMAALRVKPLIGKIGDKKANREIEKVYDAIHSSPTRSAPEVRDLEEEVNDRVAELERAVHAGNATKVIAVSENILSLVEERNRIIRLSN